MDPKALANLDPKLRETYERVMGTTTNAGKDTAPPSQSNFYTTASPTQPADGTASPTQPVPSATEPSAELSPPLTQQQSAASMPETQPSPTQTINPYANPLPSPAAVVAQTKEVSPVLKILYIVGGVIFFAAYTFFWIKVFNLQLPF